VNKTEQQIDSTYFTAFSTKIYEIMPLIAAKEARRTNTPTVNPNTQKYARCEWKCIARAVPSSYEIPHQVRNDGIE